MPDGKLNSIECGKRKYNSTELAVTFEANTEPLAEACQKMRRRIDVIMHKPIHEFSHYVEFEGSDFDPVCKIDGVPMSWPVFFGFVEDTRRSRRIDFNAIVKRPWIRSMLEFQIRQFRNSARMNSLLPPLITKADPASIRFAFAKPHSPFLINPNAIMLFDKISPPPPPPPPVHAAAWLILILPLILTSALWAPVLMLLILIRKAAP